jgi:D-alanyl-D-alanine carboxypeptidase (penicillin-binding protein 5/6)
MLVDVTSDQVLYAREPRRRFVPASVTKVMTLFHAFELMQEGYLDPRQQFRMREETWREWYRKGSTMFIGQEDEVLVDDLLMGIANISANDGSVALAEGQAGSLEAWIAGMNGRARDLGMTDSNFGTPNGWPDEGRTFTSAQDLVRLADAMVQRHPRKFARYIGRPGFSFNGIAQSNRDPMIGEVPGADGIKTGYTNEAGLTYLGTAKRGGQRLVVVVAGASRGDTRAEAARGLIEWGFAAFERVNIADEGQVVGRARVQNGAARSVGLETDRAVFVNVPTSRSAEMRVFIAYDGPLRAPLEAGSRVATLVVDVPGLEPARIPLLAQEDVEEAGFLARLWNGFAGWFA